MELKLDSVSQPKPACGRLSSASGFARNDVGLGGEELSFSPSALPAKATHFDVGFRYYEAVACSNCEQVFDHATIALL